MNNTVVSRLGAEALGTLFFVFLGGMAAITAAGGMEGAATPGGSLTLALGWALALAVAVWVFSAGGGHLNPWVTIGLALRGRFGWMAVPGHVLAQLVGGLLGALLIWWLLSSSVGDPATTAAITHIPAGAEGSDYFGLLAAEALLTLVLLGVVFHLIGKGGWKYGLGYGLTYGVGVLTVGALTGASLNFARTLGAELSASFAGGDLADWAGIWVYLVGPAVGVVLAWLVYPLVSPRESGSES